MKIFSQDVINKTAEINTALKSTNKNAMDKQALKDDCAKNSFLVSKLPDEDKDKIKRVAQENDELSEEL